MRVNAASTGPGIPHTSLSSLGYPGRMDSSSSSKKYSPLEAKASLWLICVGNYFLSPRNFEINVYLGMHRSTYSSTAEMHQTDGRCRGLRRRPRAGAGSLGGVMGWWGWGWGWLLRVCWQSLQKLSLLAESSQLLKPLLPHWRCRHGKLGKTVVVHEEKLRISRW